MRYGGVNCGKTHGDDTVINRRWEKNLEDNVGVQVTCVSALS
jgi:hypothetical protein